MCFRSPLLKSVTTPTSTSSTPTTPTTPATTVFNSIDITKGGPYKASVSFSLKEPAKCIVYIFRDGETNPLDEEDLGTVNSSYSNKLFSLTANTTYYCRIFATVISTNVEKENSSYQSALPPIHYDFCSGINQNCDNCASPSGEAFFLAAYRFDRFLLETVY